MLVVECLPRPIPLTPSEVPGYVQALRDAPGNDGVVDLVSGMGEALAYQTTHHKPVAFGYIARLPRSVAERDRELEQVLRASRYDRLWRDYRLRYVVARGEVARTLQAWPGAHQTWTGGDIAVFDVSEVR
jgi:hypothetical protein